VLRILYRWLEEEEEIEANPVPAAVSSPASSLPMWISTRTCCWCWARAAAGGRCRSAARPRWRWTVPAGSRPSPAGTDGLAMARQEGGLTASGLAQMLERRGRQAGLPDLYPTDATARAVEPLFRRRRPTLRTVAG
jgi:hypothetical protein